jgi:recombination protein RecA
MFTGMRKDINSLMAEINKNFGQNAVRPAKELEEKCYRIPTGSLSLDIDLGGGLPVGRMIQISGGFSACKSAIAYHIIANFQKWKKKQVIWDKYSTPAKPVYHWIVVPPDDPEGVPLQCALIQSESESYTNKWAEGIGVNVEDLIICYPEGMEEGLEIASKLQQSGEVDLIVHDSYAAYKPVKTLDTSFGESVQLGLKPKLFDDYHGKYQAFNNKAEREGRLATTLVALNQLREKIGVTYGEAEYTPGGRSIQFTASIDLRLRRGDWITDNGKRDGNRIGQVVKYKTHKNKTYKQQQSGMFDFYFEEGGAVSAGCIDNVKELIILGVIYGVIERRGSWFYYNGEQLAQGEAKLVEVIRNAPDIFEGIKQATTKVAFESEVEREDVFGTEEITPEDLSVGEDIVISPVKSTKKKKG